MREEYMTDRKGRPVRLLHPAPLETEDQTEIVWDDIRTAPRDHMLMSFQHRRRGIVGDCRQMKTDVDSYNDAHADAEPIQIVFDFTMDLAELEAADEAALSVTPTTIAGATSIVIAALGDVYLSIRALTGNAIDKAMFAGNST